MKLGMQERPKRAETFSDSGTVPGEELAVNEVNATGHERWDDVFKRFEIFQMPGEETIRLVGKEDDFWLEICNFR